MTTTDTASPLGMPHDRPTVAELLGAVEGFLRDEVMPASEGRLSFHARVAANALAIVERQLRLGPQLAEAHRLRLQSLAVADDAALAARIRAGDFDERFEELHAALRAAVADKLAVANPRYIAPGEEEEGPRSR